MGAKAIPRTTTVEATSCKEGGRAMECRPAVRVLLVNDDCDGANSTAMLLRQFCADVRAVYDSRLACDEALLFEPDLMLIDFSMPHLDGCAIARQLRNTQQFSATPLAVVSGRSFWRLRLRAGSGAPRWLFLLGTMPPGDENARCDLAKASDQRDGQWKSTVQAWAFPCRRSGSGREALWRSRLQRG
jgi:CheY-like chemotaxis protein